jgi:hypothetical protein
MKVVIILMNKNPKCHSHDTPPLTARGENAAHLGEKGSSFFRAAKGDEAFSNSLC